MRNKIKVAIFIIFFLILAAGGLVMASGLKEVYTILMTSLRMN